MKTSWSLIHYAIHSGAEKAVINGQEYPVKIAGNNMRYIRYNDSDLGGVRIMQQNPHKNSEYAKRARRGETLSWVIPDDGHLIWELIDTKVPMISPIQT